MKLEIFEINQIAFFKANRLMVQDLLVLDYENFSKMSGLEIIGITLILIEVIIRLNG